MLLAEGIRTCNEGLLPPLRGRNPNEGIADPIANLLLKKWWRVGESTPDGERDQVGKVFISKFLGHGDELAEAFQHKDPVAYYKVKNESQRPVDTKPFWDGIDGIFPGLHNQEEMDYLQSGNLQVRHNKVLRFMGTFQAEDIKDEPSIVLQDIAVALP